MTRYLPYARPSAAPRPTMLHQVVLGALAVALLAVSAQARVPMWPVPVTMQTLAVLLVGMALGPRLGVASVVGYLAAGFAGVPIFANGGGPAYVLAPTLGYLLSYPLAAGLVGYLATRGWSDSFGWTLLANVLGTTVIFAVGVPYLALWGVEDAVAAGLVPFLPGAALKILLAAALLPFVRRLIG